MTKTIVIVGAGGMGVEALSWTQEAFPNRQIAGFVDDAESMDDNGVAGFPILGTVSAVSRQNHDWVVAIGSTRSRRSITESLRDSGARILTVVHPSAYVGKEVTLGEGSIVCPNVTLTRDINVGKAVIINYGASVGHGTTVGDYSFVAPGVNIAGDVTVGEGTELGIGATVIQGVSIGAWARVGAGGVVIRDIPPQATAVGVPCKLI